MSKEEKSTVRAIVSSVISLGLFILAVVTCPGATAHKDKVVATIRKEIKRQADLSKTEGEIIGNAVISGLAAVESAVVPGYVKNHMVVDEFWFFSIGTFNDSDGPHFLSLGIYNTVFVFPMYLDVIIHNLA